MLSPLSLNHNNNHVDSLPQHTYATHKLPNFIEIMSSQKSRSSISDSVPTTPTTSNINHIDTVPSQTAIDTNGTYEVDEQSQHAMDLSTTSLVVHGAKSNHEIDNVPVQDHAGESTIGQYIAKNPNLTFKGSGDIMNMDIIFENVSIEEDVTIGTATTNDTKDDVSVAESSPIVTTITESQPDNLVKIDGVQYEIITVENANDKPCDDDQTTDDESTNEVVTKTINEMDATTIPEISGSYDDGNYVYTSPSEMVIMTCSSLDMAAEIETVDETNAVAVDLSSAAMELESSHAESCAALDLSEGNAVINKSESSVPFDEIAAIDQKQLITAVDSCEQSAYQPVHNVSNVKIEATTIKDEITQVALSTVDNDRKRKRKVVPVLASNKRSRRAGEARIIETKSNDVPSEKQSDFKIENQSQPPPSSIPPSIDRIEQSSTDQTLLKIKSNEQQAEEEEEVEEEQTIAESDNQTIDDGDNQDRNFMDSLFVVESQDPNDPNRTIHEVYVVDPDTNEMSEKPLDLPDHVIQRIRLSMS